MVQQMNHSTRFKNALNMELDGEKPSEALYTEA
jgi:hypothetical protein